jgi:hypothetical protein
VDHPRVFGQIASREGRLTGTVWTCRLVIVTEPLSSIDVGLR